PIVADVNHSVTITVAPTAVPGQSYQECSISALAFDAYENRLVTYAYNSTHDLVSTSLSDPADPTRTILETLAYNADGTLAFQTPPR
ncbi:hypothetical protein ABTN76_20265, partial [Acinetobacter baumannii]